MMSLGVWFIGDLIGCIRMPRLDLPANRNPEYPATADASVSWVCKCGCELFMLTPKGAICSNCWHITRDWADG